MGGLAEIMDGVPLYHVSATARWLGMRWDEGRGDGRKQGRRRAWVLADALIERAYGTLEAAVPLLARLAVRDTSQSNGVLPAVRKRKFVIFGYVRKNCIAMLSVLSTFI